MKYVIAVLILGLAIAAIGYQPVTGEEEAQEQHETLIGVIDEQRTETKAEVKVEEVDWKTNPNGCTDNQWIREDNLECIDKAPTVTKAPATPAPAAPSGNCHDWIVQAGVPEHLRADLYALIMRESGCNPSIYNRAGSGAGGIPQALPASKMGCAMDASGAVCQIKWMVNYCNARYGGIVQANQFQIANNWY